MSDIKVKVDSDKDCVQTIKVELPVARVKENIEKAFLTVRNQVKLPGFRPGKAPIEMVKENFAAKAYETAQDYLQSILATGTTTDKDLAKNALKSASDELTKASKLRDEKLEEIKMNDTAKKDPGIKNLINILERIEKNTGSIAARDKAEDKHGHKKEPELITPIKKIIDLTGGDSGGHSAGHHK
jgi:trigger factor